MKKPSLRGGALAGVFSAWTLFGLFFAGQTYLGQSYFGRGVPLAEVLLRWLPCAYVWALLTPRRTTGARSLLGSPRAHCDQERRAHHLPERQRDRLGAGRRHYVELHAGGDTHLALGTLARLEASLSPRHFLRVHRSIIVNLARIASVQPLLHGEYRIQLSTGAELTSGRTYRDSLDRLIRSSF